MRRQLRFLMCAVAAIVSIWVLAMAGHWYFESLKMTADKVRAYVDSVDFAQLTGDARARAMRELEARLNALSYDERQKLRMEHLVDGWFNQMTEAEKSQFVEATLPTGFKQMISAFQQLPDDKRRRLIDNTMKNLESGNAHPRILGGTNAPPNGTNSVPISPELEAKIRSIGLNTFYSQSSAETKAELAPVLEELQHQMESGRVILRQQ
ncbi:MAG TPA: hypothetical protein VMO20_10650 [Candidatus Acidoferrum sp.]|nr:hypothetical protein [Candidatus Acidoferrum sp.]